ncbi:putative mediator complex, subunit Med14 [Dioscorea sansibarensis]
MAAELGQQTVEFSALVRRATEDSFLALKELVERSKAPEEQSDSEKKIELLKYIVKTRQRMLRLHVLAKWCQQVPLVQYCQQLSSTLSSHDTCFVQTADSLFYMHEGLQQARAPVFDVPSALEVLLTGNYQRLPKCIEDLGMQSVLAEDQQGPTLQKLNALLRSKLLEVSLPKEISEISVSDGTAVIRVDGEFKVILSLGYRGHLSLWRILHLELLVGEKKGPVKLEETRRYALGDDLERRMAASDNPFMILYTILHEFCVALVMDTVIRQVQVLRQGRWKDAIRFELVSDGSSGQGGNSNVMQLSQDGEVDSSTLKTPGLKIFYWLDFEKNVTGSDSTSSPFIKIEPGKDLQIKCPHSSFVIDPYTDKEAEFSLDQSCIDIERLLLRAISCNRHTRLLEVQRELSKNVQICQTSGDVVLKRGGEFDVDFWKKDAKRHDEFYCGDEVLRVRAYGALYITLGINIRNGRFLLQSPKNNLEPSMLRDCEEALSQGSMTAAEVFTSLRGKSILHLFASTGKFLGLKVYEQCLSTMKIPKSILHGPDLLLMGFPQCGNSYYLLMQLDKDFKPLFKLLETQPDPDGHSHSIGDAIHVIRCSIIDIAQMPMSEDEMNLSLLNWDKLMSIPNLSSNQHSDHVLSKLGLDPVLQLTGCSPSSFSSLVDEVFEFEKGPSGTFPIQNHISALAAAPLPQFNSLPPNNHTIKAGTSSTKWEGGLQTTQIISGGKVSAGVSSSNNALYTSSSIKSLLSNSPSNLLPTSSPARNSPIQRLSMPKPDQDPSSHKSPHPSELGPCPANEEGQSNLMLECAKDIGGMTASRQSRLLSPLLTTGVQSSALVTLPSGKTINGPRSSLTDDSVGTIRNAGSSSLTTTPICQTAQSDSYSSSHAFSRNERISTKRSLSDVLTMIPSVQSLEGRTDMRKRRKIVDSSGSHQGDVQAFSSVLSVKHDEYVYGNLLSEANRGAVLSNIYVSALLHVIRHCSLCIKHARLTSQMDALDIPYVEEVGLRTPSSNLWFRLPFAMDYSWQNICLRLGKPGSMCWDVKINDKHFRELWELQKGSTTTPWGSCVRIANASDVDSHIRYDPEGVVLSYKTVEANSIEKLVSDLRRLSNARLFACGMRKLLGVRSDDKLDDSNNSSDNKLQTIVKGEVVSEQVKRTFKIEAVGLMSLWFTYGTMPVTAHFVVEWESGKEGCTIHVSPDQLWPHTKFLEDFINGAEVASFLDCIRLTSGPLLALNHAIRPARMPGPVNAGPTPGLKQNTQGGLPSAPSSVASQPSASMGTAVVPPLSNQNLHASTMLSAAGRGGPGIVPSSLLPIDVSVVLRGPYWIRIIYRKKFAVDMRCFAGDQVWLQPATPPKGGPPAGGSLPCPQFRPFIMEHVAQGLNALEPNFSAGAHTGGHLTTGNANQSSTTQNLPQNSNRSVTNAGPMTRPTSGAGGQVTNGLSRISNAMLASSGISTGLSGVPLRIPPGAGVPVHVRGELNTAFIGLGDDGGYGGGWVPLAALKKVLRGILKYLGVLWLFAQLPDLLKEILGSILKENEGALLNLDQEQPALRFFVGGYVFAVSVHRVQLLLQVLSVKRFHHQQQQQQQTQSNTQEELTQTEITEICEYFSRRVASEPYDASRVASFITLLTLPISVLREFLKLIAWKKGLSQAHAGDIAPAQRARIELCLENHSGSISGDNSSSTRSNIHHDRAHNSVDFALTFVLDPAHIPHINAAGGAAWLPYCVSVKLKYSFGENTHISLLGVEGSHGGRSCWSRLEDWEKCKHKVQRSVEYSNGNSAADINSQGRLRLVAEHLQRSLQVSLQQL